MFFSSQGSAIFTKSNPADMSTQAVQTAVAKLGNRLVRTARGFHDYNFRHYFVQHAKDNITAVQKLPIEEQKAFLKNEGVERLRQMQRMVVVNRMYGKQPVYMDRRKDGSFVTGDGTGKY